jgi:hypothetical protein
MLIIHVQEALQQAPLPFPPQQNLSMFKNHSNLQVSIFCLHKEEELENITGT